MQIWIRYKRTRDKRVLLYMVVFLYSDREVPRRGYKPMGQSQWCFVIVGTESLFGLETPPSSKPWSYSLETTPYVYKNAALFCCGTQVSGNM